MANIRRMRGLCRRLRRQLRGHSQPTNRMPDRPDKQTMLAPVTAMSGRTWGKPVRRWAKPDQSTENQP